MPNPYFSIVFIIIILLVYQLTLKLKVFYNVKLNLGKIQLKFFDLNVLDLQFQIKPKYVMFTNKKGNNYYIPIDFSQESIQEYNNFQEILFKKTYFKKMSVYFNFGLKDNAFASAMACGYADILTKIIYSVVKTKKSELVLNTKVYPSFNSNVIKFGIKAKISISIYDLLWSFLEAKVSNKIKISKNEEIQNATKQQNWNSYATGNDKNKRHYWRKHRNR